MHPNLGQRYSHGTEAANVVGVFACLDESGFIHGKFWRQKNGYILLHLVSFFSNSESRTKN